MPDATCIKRYAPVCEGLILAFINIPDTTYIKRFVPVCEGLDPRSYK